MGVIAIIAALLLEQWRPLADRKAVFAALDRTDRPYYPDDATNARARELARRGGELEARLRALEALRQFGMQWLSIEEIGPAEPRRGGG